MLFDGQSFTQAELKHAAHIASSLGITISPARVAALIRAGAVGAGVLRQLQE